MPVIRMAASVDWSTYSGAGAWIGRVFGGQERAFFVDRLADDVDDPAEHLGDPTGNDDRLAGIGHGLTADKAFGRILWRWCAPCSRPRCCATSRTRRWPVIVRSRARSGSAAGRPQNETYDDGADDLDGSLPVAPAEAVFCAGDLVAAAGAFVAAPLLGRGPEPWG